MPVPPELGSIVEAIAQRQRFLLVSHARPDGDSIGSQLALAYALRDMGKDVHVLNRDPAPPFLQSFPGVPDIDVRESAEGTFDAAVVLECGSLERTELAGLDRYFLINIDHHLGNTMYGNLNWFDGTAAACGEMVFDVLTELGAPLTAPIATHLYIAILTDTGSFHHSNITGRTFGICQELVRAGVQPAEVAACVYQNSSVGKLRLTGTLLDTMELVGDGRIAILNLNDHILAKTGCAPDDLEGLINMPLSAQPIEAVVMFKAVDGHLRVSLRSKGDVDVRAVAVHHGGGGHVNAAGFSIAAPADATRATVVAEVISAVDGAERPRVGAERTAPAS